ERASYEGQAAVELEALATGTPPAEAYPFAVEGGDPLVIDTRPLIAAAARDARAGAAPALIARLFHSTMVEMIVHVCLLVRGQTALTTVALSGGTFLNVLLTEEVTARLTAEGFRACRHRVVPPGDGGLSLGQLAVACAQIGGAVPS